MRDNLLSVIGVYLVLAGSAYAQSTGKTLERIDPSRTIAEALSGIPDDCVLLKTPSGKIFKQCPYKAAPEIQLQLDELDK